MQIYRIILKNRRGFCLLRTLFLSFIFAATVNVANAQSNKVINIPEGSHTVGDVMKSVESQTGLKFYYDENLDLTSQVAIPKSAMPLSEVMDSLLKGTGRTYSISGNIIAIHATKGVASTTTPVVKQPENKSVDKSKLLEVRYKTIPTITTLIEVEPDDIFIPAPVGGYLSAGKFNGTPTLALKTNLLVDATASIALGLELRSSQKTTFDISGAGRLFDINKDSRFRHWYIQPEFRLWTCEAFNGHFFGLHVYFSQYNIGGLPNPPFSPTMNTDRFEGWLAGAGLSYGYQWILGDRWGLEATIGVGWTYVNYEQFPCQNCGLRTSKEAKGYFSPTKAGISLIYIIK